MNTQGPTKTTALDLMKLLIARKMMNILAYATDDTRNYDATVLALDSLGNSGMIVPLEMMPDEMVAWATEVLDLFNGQAYCSTCEERCNVYAWEVELEENDDEVYTVNIYAKVSPCTNCD